MSNLTATNVAFGRTMTLTVSGSGLDAPDLALDADAACKDPRRSGATLSYQASYTCAVEGVGALTLRMRDAQGQELGRIQVAVPAPRVAFSVSQTSRSGSFTVELDPVAAPVTALNFIRYVNAGFYTGTIFHRVLPERIAQGGQYGSDKALRAALFSPIALESDNGLKNLRGTIAMARTSEPDSATAQFYINLIDNPGFDRVSDTLPGYAVFGRVVEGLEVVDQIGSVPVLTFSSEFPSLPVDDVLMTLVTQTR
ncbi:MAG: peptidylprolyl isomerase [Burkholderiales bacterium]|nr:peptidylprolyl isomerase [Burkholderiales bacterium]